MRGTELLHPKLQIIAAELQQRCKQENLPLLITDTLRTKAEQDALYAKGRTAAGGIVTNAAYPKSAHNWGVAFDFCRNVRGREYDNSDRFFDKVGALGKELGLVWGGDFKKFVDKPHFELGLFLPQNSTNELVRKFKVPEAFIASWADSEMTEVKVRLPDGKVVYIDSIMRNDRNHVALRDLLEKMGYTVGWYDNTVTVDRV